MVDHRNFTTHLLVLDGKNWDKLVTEMKVIFGAHVVCDMVETSLETLP